MCDTIVAASSATKDGALWFGKNSDREPGEAQVVEFHPRRQHEKGAILECTWMSIPQAEQTYEIALSRPFWMWGAEMGVNEFGVTIGNQAVFTRFEVAESGLTGMDLLRLALERSKTARQATELIVEFIEEFGQGGRCGYRHKNFRYHSSFVIADADEAWILETAGPYWATRRVREVWALSNALSLGTDFDEVADGAEDYARKKGWTKKGDDFDFAAAFCDFSMDILSGARARRRCNMEGLNANSGNLGQEDFLAALRCHDGREPWAGWRLTAPCAHASWQPTRTSGQTVGSLLGRLHKEGSNHWMTGTSAPCLSVFKPIVLRGAPVDVGPSPGSRFDGESLFWRHERLHRRILLDRAKLPPEVERERRNLEQKALLFHDKGEGSAGDASAFWRRHRDDVVAWAEAIDSGGVRPKKRPFELYWRFQNWLDQVPY